MRTIQLPKNISHDIRHTNHQLDEKGLLIKDTNQRPVFVHAPGKTYIRDNIWNQIKEYTQTLLLKPAEDLTVLICHDRDYITPIEQQLINCGQKFVLLHPKPGVKWKNRLKIKFIKDWLEQRSPTKYTMFADADDCLILRDLNIAVNEFKKSGCDLLFSSEENDFPHNHHFCETVRKELKIAKRQQRPFLNSGLWIGKTDKLTDLFNEVTKFDTHPTSDQAAFRKLYVEKYPKIRLDYESKIFANINPRKNTLGQKLNFERTELEKHGIALVLLNWKRTENVCKIVTRYHSYQAIQEIIVWDNSNTFPANQFPWVRTIHCSENCGLDTRFLAASLSPRDCILLHDDDLIISEKGIQSLFENWKNNQDQIHGIFGRKTYQQEYTTKNEFGDVDVVLTRVAMLKKSLAIDYIKFKEQFEHLRFLGPGNGEDIILSYLAMSQSGLKNITYNLIKEVIFDKGSEFAVSSIPGHLELRNLICRQCEELND